ncbi:MAG: DUF2147 domain-containing protein [Pseudomonadota bacterium]
MLAIRIVFGVVLATLLALPIRAEPGDALVGIWINSDSDGLIQLERRGERYFGKIVGATDGSQDTARKDRNNPDPALRNRPLLGMTMMGEYRFDGKRWSDGWIYDPDNGKRYRSRLTLRSDGQLEVRGFVGAPLFGRTQIWERQTESNQ